MNKFRAASDEAADKLKDPVAEGKFAIEDSKARLVKFRESITSALASNKMLEKDAVNADAESKKWANIARLAVESGNDQDAKDALAKRQTFDAKVKHLRTQIAQNSTVIEKTREQMRKIEDKIAAAESNHSILTARLEATKVRKGLTAAQANLTDGSNPLAALDQLEKEVNTQEAQADAFEEIAGVGKESLEEKYSATSSDVDEELSKLKTALGK